MFEYILLSSTMRLFIYCFQTKSEMMENSHVWCVNREVKWMRRIVLILIIHGEIEISLLLQFEHTARKMDYMMWKEFQSTSLIIAETNLCMKASLRAKFPQYEIHDWVHYMSNKNLKPGMVQMSDVALFTTFCFRK